MSRKILFTRKCSSKKKLKKFIKKYSLSDSYKDNFECILENDIMMVSITKRVLYVLLYDGDNIRLENQIKKFFYGDKYEQFKHTKE